MNTHAEKPPENRTSAASHEVIQQNTNKQTYYLTDNRPGSVAQRKLQEDIRARQQLKPIQKKGNRSGLPDHLKAGIENLSGLAMDDVKVHYNSDKPAQLQAHAYAQGSEIHLAPWQEKHLPHESWHVVQQKQGRVKPTLQLKGKVNVNDDAGLENEADVMGQKALQMQAAQTGSSAQTPKVHTQHAKNQTVQRAFDIGAGAPDGFAELVGLFTNTAKQVGGEVAEMINAFEADPKMHLIVFGKARPEGRGGIEGETIPAIKIGEKWQHTPSLTDEEWNTLPDTAELLINLHIYYTGDGLDKDQSKHFYTILHEFAVHAKPFYDVFKKIRSKDGPKSKGAAASLGRFEHNEQQHNDVALGKNLFYEKLYTQAVEITKAMKEKAKSISAEAIIDQGGIDRFTQKTNLFTELYSTANKKISEISAVYNATPNKENYAKFHQIIQMQTDAIKPIKEEFSQFAAMYEAKPKSGPKGSDAAYNTLLPKIKHMEKEVTKYYESLIATLANASKTLAEMK